MTCPFCQIVQTRDAAIAYETGTLLVFADHLPIRAGHVQVSPKAHFETFERLPAALATEIMLLGQRIARRPKSIYGVARVGFVFTGNEVPHVHAHVLPLHRADDVTSARYGNGAERISPSAQRDTARVLAEALGQ